jgi:hypothetical protein
MSLPLSTSQSLIVESEELETTVLPCVDLNPIVQTMLRGEKISLGKIPKKSLDPEENLCFSE